MINEIRNQAAYKIQRWWKMIQQKKLYDPKNMYKNIAQAAIIIQKYLRGKIAYEKCAQNASNMKI